MEKFVVVNGRILDYRKYEKDFSLVGKIVAADLKDYFSKMGFATTEKKRGKFAARFIFYNGDLDMMATVAVKKKGKPEFV